ncbi:murein hydrolase activator EnvC family protein [Thermodesulfobacteriota bacterium]
MKNYIHLKTLKTLFIITPFLFLSSRGISGAISVQAAENKDHISEIESELSQKKRKINLLGKKEKGILEQFAELENEISLKKSLAGRFESKINNAKRRMRALNRDLRSVEKSRNHVKRLMAKRLVALYKYASNGYLKVLANANDFGQFRQRMKYVRVILGNDHKLLTGLYEEERKYSDKIAAVKKELVTQEKQRTEMTKRLSSIKKDLDAKVVLLMKIHKDKEFYEMAVRELEFAAKNMKDTLDKIEKVNTKKESLPANFGRMKGKLSLPFRGKIIRANEFLGAKKNKKNKGIFIQSKKDAEVKAVYPGRVDFSGNLRGYGQIVIINHGSRFFTISGHLSRRDKEKGDSVEVGEVVGLVKRKSSRGARLYFEIRKGAKNLDPFAWLNIKNG